MLTKIKKKIETILASKAVSARKLGLSPNTTSFLGLIFASLSSLAYWSWNTQPILRFFAPTFLIISGFCDMLDGVIARTLGMQSKFGAFLDSLLDRYGESLVIIGIVGGGLCNPVIGILALTGSLLVSYTRARAEGEGVKMESVGLFERAERILLIVAASFLNLAIPDALSWAISILAVVTHFTVLQRTIHFFKETK